MRPDAAAFPAPLRALVERLPRRPPELLVSLALNVALCAGLLSRDALGPLSGKSLCFEAVDAGICLRLHYGAAGFRPVSRTGTADVTIRASIADFALLALRREDPDTLFFTRRLVIIGDTDLGLVVKNALDAVDWSRLIPASARASRRRI